MEEGHEFYCTQDADGHCQECIVRLMKPFNDFIFLFKEFQDKISKAFSEAGSMCDACVKANFDFGLAKLFREMMPTLPVSLRQQLGQSLLSYAMAKIKVKMPLTEKAFVDSLEPFEGGLSNQDEDEN